MKLIVSTRLRRIIAAVSATVMFVAICVLIVDHFIYVSRYEVQREQLAEAEDAARKDQSESEALEALVDRQAASSLVRGQRQQIAGIAALVAAGICVVTLSKTSRSKPELPATLAASMPSCAPPTPSQNHASSEMLASGNNPPAAPPVDLSPLEAIVERIGHEPQRLIPLLHAVEKEYHYLPSTVLDRLCNLTDISSVQVAGVVSFYSQFRTKPCGKHVVQVCQGTACHVGGADRVLDELKRRLDIAPGCDTDPLGDATVQTVGCLGCCTLAPVAQVDGETSGYVKIEDLPAIVEQCRSSTPSNNSSSTQSTSKQTPNTTNGHLSNGMAATIPLEIRVGVGSCCVAGGSRKVMEALEQELAIEQREAVIKPIGCVGICHLTPLVEVITPDSEPIVATRATPADVRRIIRALPGKAPWPRRIRNRLTNLWNQEDAASSGCVISPLKHERIRQFTDPQVRIVTEHSGEINPASLEEYQTRQGFSAIERCLQELEPSAVIEMIRQSELRGRGGGGFPTAKKWQMVSQAKGQKYLVCNGDEGDPGAFMDRMVMESYPYRVLEGMLIAAYAVGASQGRLYIRHEYPLAVERIRHAIERMADAGWLGSNILGTDFSLDIEVVEGAGAFVCGEETALLQSIMGRRGTPQHRPPYPVEQGLWDRPTLVNNVETFANVPWIIRNGPDRFAALGTETCKGTKVFSLAGKVRHGGLIEIPMGLSIRDVVEDIGGGVRDGKQFKAVQIGGPSGGCIPASMADTPIDFEALRQIGAIMGSGGLVVLDNDDCMVDVARYFIEFTQRESCGHCTFCRVGTRKLLDILERICAGKGQRRDLDDIETLSRSVTLGSLCGLGKTAPNPVLTTLQYFREEYEAHLEGRCPAGRCKGLIRYEVTRDCVGCTLCAQHCPVGAIPAAPYEQHVIDEKICTRCDVCRTTCPEEAIRVV